MIGVVFKHSGSKTSIVICRQKRSPSLSLSNLYNPWCLLFPGIAAALTCPQDFSFHCLSSAIARLARLALKSLASSDLGYHVIYPVSKCLGGVHIEATGHKGRLIHQLDDSLHSSEYFRWPQFSNAGQRALGAWHCWVVPTLGQAYSFTE